MIPQIFHIGAFPVNSFGLCVALGLFATIFSLQRSLARYGSEPRYAEGLVFVAGISGILGARLLHLIEIYDGFTPAFWSAAIAPAGFTFYGGFILAAVSVALYAWRNGLVLARVAGSAAPAVALGYAIGRLGCQLSGDGDYGRRTDSFLGMSYSSGVVPTPPGVLVYPTPLYESAICLAIAGFLFTLEKKPYWQRRPAAVFSLGVFLLALERFTVEFLRINPRLMGGLSQAQLLALVIGGASLVLFLFKARASAAPA